MDGDGKQSSSGLSEVTKVSATYQEDTVSSQGVSHFRVPSAMELTRLLIDQTGEAVEENETEHDNSFARLLNRSPSEE